jgi:uncharacterized RDD family membrane protein YckC
MSAIPVDFRNAVLPEPDPYVMWRRLYAILIDSFVTTVLIHFVLIGFPTFHLRIQLPRSRFGGLNFAFDSTESLFLGISVAVILYVLYFILFETLTGTTPGKVLSGLRVVDRGGMQASPWQALVRDILRPLDAVGAYALGGFVAVMSGRRQRIGDHAAGTMVVSVESLDDPVTTRVQAYRAMILFVPLLTAVAILDAASAFVPPSMEVAGNEAFYPVHGTVIEIASPRVQSLRSARVRLVSHSVAHAAYDINLRLLDHKQRTVSCTMHTSFVWAGALQGWGVEGMWSTCGPRPVLHAH